MSIQAKLTSLAEAMIDSLRTSEVQLPLLGLLWIGLNRLFPEFIPASMPLPMGDSLAGLGLPSAITPGWLIICLPILVTLKIVTPGRLPFVSGNTLKKEEPNA